MNYFVFIVLNILVHTIFFMSIFDIYFTSPLVHGMKIVYPTAQTPAKRLVLFVADGLRADKFFELDEHGKTRSPFLRNIMINNGTWGVSHTRVPTESRPGHIALIAGFYEDVSAIMKGWKENLVEFDSVFNRSRNTWAFGSPDILPMFAKGSSGSHVHVHCYDGSIESFAGSDSSILDDWSFDHFKAMLRNTETNMTLNKLLKQDKIIFFLHLLGLDTNGHSHKPMSKEYLSNIRKVDEGIQQTVMLIDKFYSDDQKTAYVFTSDHGMTDWGSHGAGLPSETLTPLVVWGAGAGKHLTVPKNLDNEAIEQTRMWGLTPEYRQDVNQADIAPLMAVLVGIPIPVNSVGSLPSAYISSNRNLIAESMLQNAKQIAEQFSIKMKLTKEKSVSMVPFKKLSLSGVVDRERKISELIRQGDYEKAILLSYDLIDLALEGLQYYHTYHRTYLYLSVLLSFVGWIFVCLLIMLQQDDLIVDQVKKLKPLANDNTQKRLVIVFMILGAIVATTTYLLDFTAFHFIYFLLPLFIWHFILKHYHTWQVCLNVLTLNASLRKKLLFHCTIGLGGIWSLILSFFYRFVLLIVILLVVAFVAHYNISSQTKRFWASVSIILCAFPLLPVVGRSPNPFLVVLGGLLGSTSAYYGQSWLQVRSQYNLLYILPLLSGVVASTTSYLSSNYGYVITPIHITSWSILLLGWVLPLTTSTNIINRILSIYTCQCASYILISLSYDAVFCVVFCILLCIWLKLEYEIAHVERPLAAMDFVEKTSIGSEQDFKMSFHTLRRSFILVFFLVLSFFGVGNIASINSFDVQVVLPFITVFQPFIMGSLLAYKVLLPYLLVACAYCGISVVTKTNLNQLCCFVIIISDVMGMHFFFMVKDYGSWLDIGTSISHYVINMSMTLSLLFFFAAARFLTSQKL
ncbi:GPI ethanolamine phosphate transferase 1-like [Clavelina lepadiformis]|uniref:GPI ethanolamine phosphate transferase 1-like n=1 Tax=Clavelina lepadiformis TaxID=159417 RepID=UPI004041C002